jgi:hypothetical protein
LQRTILFEAVLDDLKVVEKPAVVGVGVL